MSSCKYLIRCFVQYLQESCCSQVRNTIAQVKTRDKVRILNLIVEAQKCIIATQLRSPIQLGLSTLQQRDITASILKGTY